VNRTEDDSALIRALRSRHSGVPHDVAAAYATVALRSGSLLEAIAQDRIPLPARERDAVFAFAQRSGGAVDGEPEPELDAGEDDGSEFALADPPEPERRAAVRGRRPQHFSASALNAYAECARKWYYRYVCSAVEDSASSASIYGTAFHAALEDFHAEFPRPAVELQERMRSQLERHVHFAFERFRDEFATAVEAELQERRAQRTARRYVDWLIAEARRSPFTVIGRELPANLDLDGYAFVGFIDRLDRDDASGSVSIFDYKTGTIAESAAEYREKIRRFRDFQLPFYYWARVAEGDRVWRIALIPLKDALVDVEPVALVVGDTITVRELERARERMIEICRELSSSEIESFPVTRDPSACTYCAYTKACVDRPHDERESFGR
jgi:RecB family exonuclease